MAFAVKKKTGGSSSESTKQASVSKPNLLMSGKQAKKAFDKQEAEFEQQKAKSGKAWRFRMQPDEDAAITFLDGAIDPETGILAIPYVNEHTVKLGSKYETFVCIADEEPCPACEAGDSPSFVGYLTVLDHRPWKDKDGKEHDNTRRLYAAKSGTLKQLTKLAEKNDNGLIGVTYDVSRTGDKKAAVGDMFDKQAVHEIDDIIEQLQDEGKPLDYAHEMPYLSAEQMVQLGIGTKSKTIGSSSFGAKKSTDVDDDDIPF